MILTRAPLTLDLLDARGSASESLVVTLDKYFYVVINQTPLISKVVARYSEVEVVDNPSQLKNKILRNALIDFGINSNIEIGLFASLPSKVDLGSTASFCNAIVKGLAILTNKKLSQIEIATMASKLRQESQVETINPLIEIGSAIGGFNHLKLEDQQIKTESILIDLIKLRKMEQNFLIYYLGENIDQSKTKKAKVKVSKAVTHLFARETSRQISDLKSSLLASDLEKIGQILSENYQHETELDLVPKLPLVQKFIDDAINQGATGAKYIQDCQSGILLIISPTDRINKIDENLKTIAAKESLKHFTRIDFHFVHTGVEVQFYNHST